MNSRITGIIWVGPIFHASGYGNVSRNFLRGFKKIGFPVKAINLGPDDRKLLDSQILKEINELTEADVGPYPVVVVHHNPLVYSFTRCKNVVKKIGYTIFETDRIPREWVSICNHMDEVWVPSFFNFQTFMNSGVYPEKIKIFPYGVDTDFFKPIDSKLFIEGKRSFCFLYVSFFDYRKGFDLLLESYLKEFNVRDDVSLIIKTGFEKKYGISSKRSPTYLKSLIIELIKDKIDFDREDLPHFEILTEPFDQLKLRELYNTCDLFISTDRANGWGMPCMEAMAMGKPVASIAWGGGTEFMNEDNSLPIKPTGRLVPVDERLSKVRPIYKGHQWAEVTVDEVRKIMRYAYENKDILPEIGHRGMEYIRENYSLTKAAEKIRDYLLSIPVQSQVYGKPEVRISFTGRAMVKLQRLIGRK